MESSSNTLLRDSYVKLEAHWTVSVWGPVVKALYFFRMASVTLLFLMVTSDSSLLHLRQPMTNGTLCSDGVQSLIRPAPKSSQMLA